eukprot:gnl/MRDRNA2_/MRDRNA2_86458_c0_seq2.p1 gnl/MRDRNA2_/MRDRNA2_86458_c0~~gnl/MRDRNA2_/MRDRNA2_86458_c0_seq2.p1  ORF type:complete len:579 (+),score=61.09 gnl/MRDRNA2_/MRDRNA2_86458_c0_seq2:142-1737(+)
MQHNMLQEFDADLEEKYISIQRETVKPFLKYISIIMIFTNALFWSWFNTWQTPGELLIYYNDVCSLVVFLVFNVAVTWSKSMMRQWDTFCFCWCLHRVFTDAISFNRANNLLGIDSNTDLRNQPESYAVLRQIMVLQISQSLRAMPVKMSLILSVLTPVIWLVMCTTLGSTDPMSTITQLLVIHVVVSGATWVGNFNSDLQFRFRFTELQREQSEKRKAHDYLFLLRAFADATALLKGRSQVYVMESSPGFDSLLCTNMLNAVLRLHVFPSDVARFDEFFSECFKTPLHMPLKRLIKFMDLNNMQFEGEVSIARIADDEIVMAVSPVSSKVSTAAGLDLPSSFEAVVSHRPDTESESSKAQGFLLTPVKTVAFGLSQLMPTWNIDGSGTLLGMLRNGLLLLEKEQHTVVPYSDGQCARCLALTDSGMDQCFVCGVDLPLSGSSAVAGKPLSQEHGLEDGGEDTPEGEKVSERPSPQDCANPSPVLPSGSSVISSGLRSDSLNQSWITFSISSASQPSISSAPNVEGRVIGL